jgi:hypothetical protein
MMKDKEAIEVIDHVLREHDNQWPSVPGVPVLLELDKEITALRVLLVIAKTHIDELELRVLEEKMAMGDEEIKNIQTRRQALRNKWLALRDKIGIAKMEAGRIDTTEK